MKALSCSPNEKSIIYHLQQIFPKLKLTKFVIMLLNVYCVSRNVSQEIAEVNSWNNDNIKSQCYSREVASMLQM